MRANITINRHGSVIGSHCTIPPDGGITATRVNQNFSIALDKQPSVFVLLEMIRILRAINDAVALVDPSNTKVDVHNRSSICLLLAQKALNQLEGDHKGLFSSKVRTVTHSSLQHEALPDELLRLSRLQILDTDVPTALVKLFSVQIQNLVLIGHTLSMQLCFIAVPRNLCWPSPEPLTGQPLSNFMAPPHDTCLKIIYELSPATRQQIYHCGTMRLPMGETRHFKRLIYPLTGQDKRSHHYRIATTAVFSAHPGAVTL